MIKNKQLQKDFLIITIPWIIILLTEVILFITYPYRSPTPERTAEYVYTVEMITLLIVEILSLISLIYLIRNIFSNKNNLKRNAILIMIVIANMLLFVGLQFLFEKIHLKFQTPLGEFFT